MRNPIVVLTLILVGLAVQGCSGLGRTDTARPTDARELSPKLHQLIYYEQGETLFVAADGRAAQYVEDGEMFPVGIGLANFGKTPLTFGTESFVLETENGERFPVVGYEEYLERYTRSKSDARVSDTFAEALQGRFQNYRSTSWNPFPVAGSQAATQSRVELGLNFWTRTYLYFPIPESGIHDREFTLVVTPDGTDERFLVRFAIR